MGTTLQTVMAKVRLLACVLFFAVFFSCVAADETNERAEKALNVFSVVKFPNDVCTGQNGLNGTCYTTEECAAKGGAASGTCASGFGVCCTFSLTCGSTSSENNTYVDQTTFTTW